MRSEPVSSAGQPLPHSRSDRPPVKVVVTGGAGFIGANLCRALPRRSRRRPDVVALDDLSTGNRAQPRRRSTASSSSKGRSSTPACWTGSFDGADAVVHLAARPSVPRSLADPMASHLTNATGTMEVLEAARRRGRPQVVVASSSSVYGANPALPKREDMATMPVSPYAASKLAAESATLAYGRSFDLPVLAFRFFNVFGPLQARRPRLRRRGPRLRVRRAARATRSPSTATGARPATSPTWGACRRCWPRPSPAKVTAPRAGQPGLRHQGVPARAHRRPREGARTGPRTPPHRAPEPATSATRRPTRPGSRAMFPDVEPVGLEEGLRATVEWFRAVR